MKLKASPYSNLFAVLIGLAMAYVAYMITRVAFVLENWNLFAAGWDSLSLGEVLAGSLRFDSSAILYTNSLWIVLMLLPVHTKERPWWHTMCRWIYVVVNSFCLSINLADAVYSQFTGRRTTATFFSEFSNEDNLGGIFFTELVGHWYLLLLGIALIAALWLLYPRPLTHSSTNGLTHSHIPTFPHSKYYLVNSLALLVAIPMAVFAMRGGFTRDTRPITISNANQYVRSPQQASIVLNTPFSIIRTIGKRPFKDPHYMSEEEMTALYTPIHVPQGDELIPLVSGQKNVVVFILESFSREYFGYYNQSSPLTSHLSPLTSYTPFLDSLLAHSLTYEHTFANGRKSIDAMPSSLSSVPYFVEPFILTPSSLNDLSGIADCLSSKGYSTAFFHGAPNSSMGFQAFARSSGFQRYFGMSEYCDDPRFNGRDDFDGHWAIWDEEFLQFMALSITDQLAEPFMTGTFTATSHHPFSIPARYREVYKGGPLEIHRCIQYSDNALRKFFDTARQQPWFQNTLFVFTADHTNMLAKEESNTSLGVFSIPIFIYDPSGELPTGIQPGVMQQIDIMPTILRILGYDQPYLAFGKDMFQRSTPQWAVNYTGGIYQYIEGDYLLLFDGVEPTALYNYVDDPLLKTNLLDSQLSTLNSHLSTLKAIIQTYMIRMTNNNLVIRENN